MPEPKKLLIHELIRARRLKVGKTEAEVAKEAGLKANAYRAIEAGERDPRLSTLVHICRSLRILVEELLNEDDFDQEGEFARAVERDARRREAS